MKMKLFANFLILMGLGLMVIGVISKFYCIPILLTCASPLAHIALANTMFLLALILKLAND